MLTPTAPATISPALSVGQPVWIGHGKIVSARFLSGTKQIAIGWASGISLHAVDTGQELWFQPTPGNVIAFDVQPQEHTFAAALGDGRVMTFDASTGAPHQYQSEMKNAPWGGMLEPQRRPGFPVASLQKVV